MGIQLASNFDVNAALPLDSRMIAADATARDAIIAGVRYEGMLVYVVADQTMYQLQGGITNGDWAAAGGGGGGSVPIVDLATGDGVLTAFTLSQDPGTEENVAVYLDGVRQSTTEYSIVTTTLTFTTAPYNGATLMFVSGSVNTVNVPADGSVTTAKIADANVTDVKIVSMDAAKLTGSVPIATFPALNSQLSSSCAVFSSASTSFVDVTNLSVSLTTTGRPVLIALIPDGSTSPCGFSATGVASQLIFLRGATQVATFDLTTTSSVLVPCSAITTIDFPAAGTYTIKARVKMGSGNTFVQYAKLIAYEL